MERIETRTVSNRIYRTYRENLKDSSIESIGPIDSDSEAIQKSWKQRRVAEWVEKLLDAYGHSESLFFYRKAAWHLSDNDLVCLMEDSEKPWVKDSHRYFIFLANKKLKQRA